MKTSGLLLCVFLASICRLAGQVTVEVTLDQDEFLPGESLPAVVRITNRSGQTLQMGKTDDWLTFTVESRDSYVVLKTGEAPVAGEFSLASSKRAIKRVDLAPYFNIQKPGRYSITAYVTLQDWNPQQLTSKPKNFDIIEGAQLWERVIGVPQSGNTNAPEIRKYALQEANYLRHHLMLYFRLTDASGKLNKVFPLGPMLSFGQPEPQVDKASNLHVLFQNGPHSFHYTVIDPSGNMIIRQTYLFTSRPRIQSDADGNLKVVGGQRREGIDDVPPPSAANTNAAPSTP